MATSCQTQLGEPTSPVRTVQLRGAQEGLVLTITSQNCIVHWPGSIPKDESTRLIDTTITTTLPYQEGESICDTEASTEVLNNSDNEEINIDNGPLHAREILMVRRPRSLLDPPEAPDVRSSDESESNISPFTQGYEGETESQKQAREKRNKLKQGRQCRARQRKEAWIRYESDIAKYN